MKHLISLGIACLLTISSVSGVFAQEFSPSIENVDLDNLQVSPNKLILIKELRRLTNLEENEQKILIQMREQSQKQIKQSLAQYLQAFESTTNLPPEFNEILQETIIRISSRFNQLMDSELNLKDLSQKISIYTYNKYYSEKELEDLIAFYKTETGQKTTRILPQLTSDSLQLFNQHVTPKIIELQTKILKEELQNFQKNIEEMITNPES